MMNDALRAITHPAALIPSLKHANAEV